MKKMILEEIILAILIMTMVILAAAQAFSRRFFHISLSHTEEIVRYLFVWATFLGAAGAAYRGRHLSAAGRRRETNAPFYRKVRFITGLCAILFMAALFIYGIKIAALQAITAQKTAALGLPMWWIGLSVPVGAALIMYRILQRALNKGER